GAGGPGGAGGVPPDGDDRTILDVYEVGYAGLDKPVLLYLDAYHFDDALKAPKGFVCAVPIGLSAPPPDTLLAQDSLRALAIEQGASRDFAPIPLDAGGGASHGVLFDHFRLIARASRAAKAAGSPLDPNKPTPDITRTRMVVVAYPVRCGDRDAIAPLSLEIVAAEGQPPRRDGELATGG